MKKSVYILIIIAMLVLPGSLCFSKDESIIGLSGHELGDHIFSIRAGLLIPLFFHDFEGNVYPSNSSLGASGAIQWNFYLNQVIRIGMDVGLAFSLDPNLELYNMIPITINGTYVFTFSRFEFPVSLSAGINILNYQDLYHLGLLIRPSVAAFWRFDTNLSFGIDAAYWWTMEFGIGSYPPISGNFIDITPSLFYHF